MGIASGGEKTSMTIEMEKGSSNDQATMSTWKAYWVSFGIETLSNVF